MKKLLVITLLLFSVSAVFGGETEKKAKLLADNLKSSLGLTKKQREDIYKITLDKLNIQAEYKSKEDNESQQKFILERRAYHLEIGKQLTTEQYNKWMQLRKDQVKLKKEGKEIVSPIIDENLEYLN